MKTKSKLVVFLVDDDPFYLMSLEHYLRHNFTEITLRCFTNGEACLHEIHLEPDLVLLDYKLDSSLPYAWNGLQVLKHIRELDPVTRVILISAHAQTDTILECMQEGALDFILKDEDAFEKARAHLLRLHSSESSEDGLPLQGYL